MINELLTFRRSLETWGIEVPRAFHPKINGNSRKGHGLTLTLDVDGTYKISENPEFGKMYFYCESNHEGTPSFKFNNDPTKFTNLAKACTRNFAFIQTLADKVGETHDSDLALLGQLAERAAKVDVFQLVKDLLAYLESVKESKPVYLSLELTGKRIQTIEFIKKLSDVLVALDQTEGDGLDFLGKSLSGYEDIFPQIKVNSSIGRVPVYCRNNDNGCFARFGLNSVEACRLGSDSRRELSDVLQFVLDEKHESKLDQAGIWFSFTSGKRSADRPTRDFLVLTTLFPHDEILEVGNKDVKSDDWENHLRLIVASMKKLSTAAVQPFGQVVIIRKLKGAWKVVMSESKDLAQISQYVERWVDGIYNGSVPKFAHAPTVYSFTMFLNSVWNQSGKEIKRDLVSTYNIEDTYNFLFDHQPTIIRIAQTFADRHVKAMIKMLGLKFKKSSDAKKDKKEAGSSFDLQILGPMQNLILHKLGWTYNEEEQCMHHWAFYLGQVLQEANRIYYKYFKTRGLDVPDRIGQRFIMAAYLNPQMAYHNFILAFGPTHNWAEKINPKTHQTNAYMLRYRELVTKLSQTMGDEMTMIPTPTDRMMLSYGYMHYIPYVTPEEEESLTEVVPAAE